MSSPSARSAPAPEAADDDSSDLAAVVAERDALLAERDALLAERDALRAEREALATDLSEAAASVVRWRSAALHRWESAAQGGITVSAQQEIDAMRNTLSWRVTKPLRAVRSRLPNTPGAGG